MKLEEFYNNQFSIYMSRLYVHRSISLSIQHYFLILFSSDDSDFRHLSLRMKNEHTHTRHSLPIQTPVIRLV